MQDEADRAPGRRSRAARRARDGDPPADDVLARLGIRAPEDDPPADDVLARLGIRAPAEEPPAPSPAKDPGPATTELPPVQAAPASPPARPPAQAPRPAGPPALPAVQAPRPPDSPLPPAQAPRPTDSPAPGIPRAAAPPAPRIPRAAAPAAPGTPRAAAPPVRPGARTGVPASAPRGAAVARPPHPPAVAPSPPRRPPAAPPAPETPTPADPNREGPPREGRRAGRTEQAVEVADDEVRVESRAERTRRIDASLTRLSAAHTEPDEPEPEDVEPGPARRADRRADEPARPSRLAAAGRVAAAVLAAVVFLGMAGSWGATRWMDSTVRTVSALDPTTGVVGAEGQAGDENLLLLGTASGTSGAQSTTADRADTLMLTHVPADGSRVVAVSLPLGLEINRPPCERWDPAAAAYLDETVSAETRTPLASAYRVGGPRCLVRTVQQLTGIAVTRFVALDLPGVGGMVDALGGVDMCLERPVRAGTELVPAGSTRWDGAQAALVAQTADPAQVARQQRLLAATFGEALSTSTLLSPTATRDFAAALGRSMLADDTGVQDLLRLTSALGTASASPVPLPVGAVPNTRGNLDLRGSEANGLFEAVREHQPLPELSTPVATASGPEPGDVTVNVLNAADRTGLAGEVGGSLRTLGFGVGEVGNAAEPAADTLLRFSPDRADAAELLGRVVPAARLVQDPAGSGTLQLVLGTSFDGVVRAPVTDPADDVATGEAVSCD